jgi:hypothetical protein
LAQTLPGGIPFSCQPLSRLINKAVRCLSNSDFSHANHWDDRHTQTKNQKNKSNGTFHDHSPGFGEKPMETYPDLMTFACPLCDNFTQTET